MDHAQAASYLLAARRTQPGAPLPPGLRPRTADDAYEIQRLTMAQLGPIGGWKVGAAGPDAPPSCAPMPLAGLHAAPARLSGSGFTSRDIESEIAFRLAADLPARAQPYTRADILGAIDTCFPGIEILQSRYAEPAEADPLSNLADLIRHGAYVTGTPIADWESVDFAAMEVVQTIGGVELRRQGNPAGDMIRLISWLANEGAAWAGGLRAGQVITCGSWTGATPAAANAVVTAAFCGLEPVALRFD